MAAPVVSSAFRSDDVQAPDCPEQDTPAASVSIPDTPYGHGPRLRAAPSPWLRLHLLLFPAACRKCGRIMDPLRSAHAGMPYVCSPCHAGLPWRSADGPESGGAVSTAASVVERVWAPWRHEEPVRRWIHGLKYEGRDGLAIAMGRLAAAGPQAAAALNGVDLIAPVPLHRRRLRERGFNQAALIAHHWLRGLARLGYATPPLVPDLLARTRYTTPQVRLNAEQREANVAGAFGPGRAWRRWAGRPGLFGRGGAAMRAAQPEEQPLAGLRVLLVDDVMTTGATMAACAQVLREAGAVAADALVMARTD